MIHQTDEGEVEGRDGVYWRDLRPCPRLRRDRPRRPCTRRPDCLDDQPFRLCEAPMPRAAAQCFALILPGVIFRAPISSLDVEKLKLVS
jgi:hypothetical protein